jgi:hypothetical protein
VNGGIRNATGFVIAVENNLGWAAEETPETPLWKVRAAMAGRLNKKIKTDPELYSWENLSLTLAYCRRNKIAVKSPLGVLLYIDKALAERPKVERARPLQDLVNDAIAREVGIGDEDSAVWIARFSRASGPGLVALYRDWVASGRVTP